MFLFAEQSEKHLQEIEHYGNQQAWQEVDGLAVLDAEDAEARAEDEYAANDAQFCTHGFRHSVAEEVANSVENTLPAKEDGGGKEHYPSVGGGKHGRGNEVERCVGI